VERRPSLDGHGGRRYLVLIPKDGGDPVIAIQQAAESGVSAGA